MKTMDQKNIYFDHGATTPLSAEVYQVMKPYFQQDYGNPSSVHHYGQKAESAVEGARLRVSELLKCEPEEIFFTSGGSESDNLALRGAAFAQQSKSEKNHLLITPVEHPAVSKTAQQLQEHFGFELEIIPVSANGIVDPDDLEKLIRPETALISIIFANNEIGSINPINEIGEICRKHGVPFHSDAVQAAAHLPLDLSKLEVDLLSIGAHKFYGPKGAGILYIREGTPMLPVQTGGSQENGLRAGTSNVPYIVGQAKAFELVYKNHEQDNQKLSAMRDFMIGNILENIPGSKLTGHPAKRLPNHASFAFDGVDGNQLLIMLDIAGYSCSSGSACKTGNPEPSETLLAIGLSPEWALGSLRVTLGRQTTQEHIHSFIEILPKLIKKNRVLKKI